MLRIFLRFCLLIFTCIDLTKLEEGGAAMKKLFYMFIFAFPLTVFCQTACFTKTFGGAGHDFPYSVQQTTGEGYIIAGLIDSHGGESADRADLWIVKLDRMGEIEWEKTYGGDLGDVGFSIRQIPGKGYIVAGTSSSFGKRNPSAWILYLDNKGDTLWTRLFEGRMDSYARSVQVTLDSGYIIAGKGDENILKLNKDGKKEWGRRYGWIFNSVDQTSDGGYILGGDSIYKQLEWDYIPTLTVVKTDREGNLEWKNPFGSVFPGSANSVEQTSDGGYIIAGDSIYMKPGNEHAHYLMVGKLDRNGNRLWTYYGNEYSGAQSVRQTSDEGFIISGNSIDAEHGLDVLLVRLNKSGEKIWSKTFGESDGWEYASDALQTSDNGYMVAAQADSYGAGRYDWWVLKLDENGNGPGPTGIPELYNADFTLWQNYPNPFRFSTAIRFSLPQPGFVTLKIYNLSGQEIESVTSRYYPQGEFLEIWNPAGHSGGIYLLRLQYGDKFQSRKMILLE